MSQIRVTENTSIKYQIDKLITKTTGIFITLAGAGFNLQEAQTVTGFSISVSEPAHTGIYYAFRSEDYWFSLNPQGMAQNFATGTPTFDDLKEYGNTTSELRTLSDIPAFAGKDIQVAIALEADDVMNARPTVNSLSVNYRNDAQQLSSTQYSALYELGEGTQIASCTSDTEITGEADIELTAQLTKSDGTVTDWQPLNMLTGQTATKIQFKGTYSVGDIGSGTAKVRRADVIYSDGSNSITGQVDAELYSITQDWYMTIRQARLTVKHSPLTDSEIEAYVSLRAAPKIVSGEVLGVGSGGKKTYQVKNTNGIKYDSIRLYFDNSRIYTGYEVNTEVGRITCEAPEGVIVSCDYEYGWEVETWHKMRQAKREGFPDYDQTEYRYETDGEAKTVCGLKLVLHMETGDNLTETCGIATGGLQTVRLNHAVRDGRIMMFYSEALTLPEQIDGKNWMLLDDPQYVRVSAPEGTEIMASYDWVSEAPTVYQFAGVFAE